MGWDSVFKGSQVDAALDRIMDNGFVHYRGRTPAAGHWRMNGSGDMMRPERYDGASWVPQGVLLSARQRTLYVAKHGADTNPGTNPDAPFLTFGAALTAAAALTPSQSAPVVITCQDAGAYTEDLVGVAWVRIYAPGATLIPATNAGHEIKDGCRWRFFRATRIHTGFKMTSGGAATVELAEAGTEAGAVNGQWLFLVDGRGALLGGTLNAQVGAYRGEACICGCYGDADEGFINFSADSIDVVAGGTSTWWDFFAEQSVVGKRCDINMRVSKYRRLASGAGCFRPFAANPGVRVSINAIAQEVNCPSGTVCEAAKSGVGTGAYCSLIADDVEGQTIANAVATGNKVRIVVARKPSPFVLAGVTSEIAILDPSGVTASVFTAASRLEVSSTADATSPTSAAAIHTPGGLAVELGARVGGGLGVSGFARFGGTTPDGSYIVTVESGSQQLLQMRRNNSLGGGFQFEANNGNAQLWLTSPSYGRQGVLFLDYGATDRLFLDVAGSDDASNAALMINTSRHVHLRQGLYLPSDKFTYFGDAATDGTWRIGLSGNDMILQRRESSTWVTKQTFTP